MDNSTTLLHLVSTLAPLPEFHPANITEGGILSGRNPFHFVKSAPLPTFIVQLVVIVSMSRFVKFFLNPIRQPAVIAETISGILLGPTVMGRIPNFSNTIFPKQSLPFLNLMSNFGLVMFLFLVGLELDPRCLRRSMKSSLAISLTGMGLPFILGAGTSYILYHHVEPLNYQNGFTRYFLFLGVAMAITAFPVLARILTELNLLKTRVGGITISAAAVDDACSWCLLALVISLINAGSGLVALYVFLMGLIYSLFLIFAVRPIFIVLLRRAGAFENTPSQNCMFCALMIVFISAFITDAIGIHAIFGGFLAGIIMPHEGGFAYHINEKLEDIVGVLFLPLYFALSGLRTEISSLDDAFSWGIVLLVISVACFGKIIGCAAAARLTNIGLRESFVIGTLMGCKVLNLGYDSGVISQRTFAIMVIMALATTFITVPTVNFLYPPKYHCKVEEDESTHETKKKGGPPSLLVSVNKIEQVSPILSLIHLLQVALISNTAKDQRKGSKGSQSSVISLPALLLPNSCMNPSKDHGLGHSPNKGVILNSLRLIELTERDSSVMLQTSQDALRNDPVTTMLRTFCMNMGKNLSVRSMVKVVTQKRFGETLVKMAEEVNAKYILVPWSGSGSVVEDMMVSPIQQVFSPNRRRQSFHTLAQHSSFIQTLLTEAKSTVLILIDRSLRDTSPRLELFQSHVVTYTNIYFPFFGGPDDREALRIVMGLSPIQGIKISVVRYMNISAREYSKESSEYGSAIASEDHVAPPELLFLDSQDDDLINGYFGTHGKRASFYANISYSEVESYAPITVALQYLNELDSSDLVVVGKGSARLGDANLADLVDLKKVDGERRKVLGDLVETVLLCDCNAGLLVVQAPAV